jgi:hypothetical protein
VSEDNLMNMTVCLGVGDTGDNWRVICDGSFWERGDSVSLKHLDTNTYLATSGF